MSVLSGSRAVYRDYSDRLLRVPEIQYLSWLRPRQRPAEWGGEGKQASNRIRLVIADERDDTLPSAHLEGYGAAKSNARAICLVHQLRGRLPRAPVAQLAASSFDRVVVSQVRQCGVQFDNSAAYLFQPAGGDKVRTRRDGPLKLRFEVFVITFAPKKATLMLRSPRARLGPRCRLPARPTQAHARSILAFMQRIPVGRFQLRSRQQV